MIQEKNKNKTTIRKNVRLTETLHVYIHITIIKKVIKSVVY